MKKLVQEIADLEDQAEMLDKENEILREEYRTLEHGKQNGKQFTIRELDSYANVNLRASQNKKNNLVRDGGKLQPIGSPKAFLDKAEQVYSLNSERSKHSLGTNKSRLVVRDNPDGTTQMLKIKPSGIPKLRQSRGYEAVTPSVARRASNDPSSSA